MRMIAATALAAACLAMAGCNTVRGAGEDAKSVGRVFSDKPDSPKSRPQQ